MLYRLSDIGNNSGEMRGWRLLFPVTGGGYRYHVLVRIGFSNFLESCLKFILVLVVMICSPRTGLLFLVQQDTGKYASRLGPVSLPDCWENQ